MGICEWHLFSFSSYGEEMKKLLILLQWYIIKMQTNGMFGDLKIPKLERIYTTQNWFIKTYFSPYFYDLLTLYIYLNCLCQKRQIVHI